MQVMFFFTIIAIVFTLLRGAFLGLAVILSVLIWRSPWRVRFAMFLLVATFISIPFLPSQLSDRINSIGEQESEETRDGSVQGRFEPGVLLEHRSRTPFHRRRLPGIVERGDLAHLLQRGGLRFGTRCP